MTDVGVTRHIGGRRNQEHIEPSDCWAETTKAPELKTREYVEETSWSTKSSPKSNK